MVSFSTLKLSSIAVFAAVITSVVATAILAPLAETKTITFPKVPYIEAVYETTDLVHPSETSLVGRGGLEGLLCNLYGIGPRIRAANYITDGINYLKSKGPNTRIMLAPRSCSRISCSYQSGIFLCNDNYSDIDPPIWFIVERAQLVADACNDANGFYISNYNGQAFDTDKWNVIIKGDYNSNC